MTDDELEAKLRRLAATDAAAQAAEAPDKGAERWDAMAAEVRTAYDRELRNQYSVIRRRRWLASAGAALAMAATLTLWLRHSHNKSAATAEPGDTFHVFEDLDPGEMLEELSPAELDHLATAFNKGA
ncbi:MAG: hypothetical protein JWM53_6434 [bacterium]|nr:hypothetical protein [bacterium]